jgi:hypothetical protein
MPNGTALCVDCVNLSSPLDEAIMPLLKSKFVVVSAMPLRAKSGGALKKFTIITL